MLSTRFSRLLLSHLNRLLRPHNVVTEYSDYLAERNTEVQVLSIKLWMSFIEIECFIFIKINHMAI